MALLVLKSSQISLSGKTTANLAESGNLYFTDARARGAISAGGNLAYNAGTGVISYTTPNSDGIAQGTTNKYFSDALARGAISASGNLSYNNSTGVMSFTTPSLNAIPAPTASLDLSDEKIINLADGVAASDAVTKGQLDNAIAGLHWKESVRVATTTDGTLASDFTNGDTVDGQSLTTGDRILIKNQASASENGIYVVKASGQPDRSSDMNTASEFAGSAVFIRQGTTNADSAWVCTNDAPPTVGSTAINFSQFSGAGQLTAGAGITITGNTVSIGTGAVAHSMIAANIPNASLANSAVSFGGVSLALGATDATPAFDLQDATGYPTTALVGSITNAQLGGSINESKLAGAIGLNKMSWITRQEVLTTNGSTTGFNLATASSFDNKATVQTYLNGMRMQNVGTLSTSPAIATEYKVTHSSTTTTVTFGVAPAADDYVAVDYLA